MKSAARFRGKVAWPYLVAGAALLGVFILQAWQLGLVANPRTDEGVYAEAGRLLLSGRAPHRDFLLVHLPLLPAAIGAGLKIFGSMHALRLMYLALNLAGIFVFFAFLLRVRRAPWAALAACLCLATYSAMVHHDFRFISLRQTANLFVVGVLWNELRSLAFDALASGLACLTFLPSVWNLALVFAGLAWSGRTRVERRALAFHGLRALGVGVVLAAVYLAAVPGAFDQVVLEQLRRPFVPYFIRLEALWYLAREDVFFDLAGLAGLVAGAVFDARLRPLSLAMLGVVFGSVFGGAGFYPHYVVAAAWALGWGLFCLLVVVEERLFRGHVVAAAAGAAALVGVHLAIVGPSLVREWTTPPRPGFYELVSALERIGGPVLTLDPVFAVEAGVPITPFFYQADARMFRVRGERLREPDLGDAEARACAILVDSDTALDVLPAGLRDRWRGRYAVVAANAWGTVLATGHPGCRIR